MKFTAMMELDADKLRDYYWNVRETVYSGAQVKSRNLGYWMRQQDMIVTAARKRGIDLRRAA